MSSLQAITVRCNHLEQVIRLQGLIARERNNPQLSSLFMKEIASVMDADRGTLFLYDSARNELRTDYVDGLDASAIVVPLKMGVIGAAIGRRRSINIVNAHEHAFFNNITDKDSGYRTDTMLALPIIAQNGSVLGGLQLINKFGGRFTQKDEGKLSAAANTIAAHSENGLIDAAIASREISGLQAEIGCDRSAVFQLDEKSGHLVSIFASGTTSTITVKIKLGIAGYVALTGTALLVAAPYSDARFDPSFDNSTGYRTRNILTVPLKTSTNEILGVIQVLNKYGGCFTNDDVELLVTIAGAIGTTLENRNLIRDLDLQFHSLLEVMAASLDSRDKLTAGHSLRVAELAVSIAAVMGFTEEDTDILKVAATLHDYGKVGVDDAVLRKNGALSTSEYQHIKTHAETTFDILEKVHFANKYRSVPLIASSHHEALDGSGYPHGLHENEIPLMSKILSVADVFEALTADRHYRKGMSQEAALEILDAGIGTKFDSRIVQALKQSLAQRDQATT
jgi:HD-GYP domain-containing protein (c-di-GMP phosphodiesterase class II)